MFKNSTDSIQHLNSSGETRPKNEAIDGVTILEFALSGLLKTLTFMPRA
jgi:hypothetical protein